jgi:hypothetical protein
MDVAFLLGMSINRMLDPLVIVAGLLIGFAVPLWWQKAVALVAISILMTLLVRMVDEFGTGEWALDSAIARTLALFAWALIGWGARWLVRRKQKA